MYGFGAGGPLSFKPVPTSNFGTLYYVDDEELDFDDIINAPMPKIPLDICFTGLWLSDFCAIEINNHYHHVAHWLAIEGVQPSIPQNPAPIGIIIILFDLFYRALLVETRIEMISKKLKAEGRYDLSDMKVDVKPLVRHVISKEMQLYFEKIVEALLSGKVELVKTALESISEDNGIQQLLPYFIQFATDQVCTFILMILFINA